MVFNWWDGTILVGHSLTQGGSHNRSAITMQIYGKRLRDGSPNACLGWKWVVGLKSLKTPGLDASEKIRSKA